MQRIFGRYTLTASILIQNLNRGVFASAGNERTWINMELIVPVKLMSDPYELTTQYSLTQARTLFGTPPQPLNLTIGFFNDTLLSAWGVECEFCTVSDAYYYPELSLTVNETDVLWPPGVDQPKPRGHYAKDTIGFEGLFEVKQHPFVIMDELPQVWPGLPMKYGMNGMLSLYVNGTAEIPGVWQQLWKQGSLMNPVIGTRWDPFKPRLTVGALDPEDYDGEINWVPLVDRYGSKGGIASVSEFNIDGLKGFNGSLLPFGPNPTAILNSFFSDIQIPPSNPSTLDEDYFSPQSVLTLDGSGHGYVCNDTHQLDVNLTVTINGVDYPLDSAGNMLRASSDPTIESCILAITHSTVDGSTDLPPSDFSLGLPFMRSVYVAYRFPTEDCPGYYGFAFPSGLNRTTTQISQKPRSIPDRASECLALVAPTSTPSSKIGPQSKARTYHNILATGSYKLYSGVNGTNGAEEVALVDGEFLDETRWNISVLNSGAGMS